MLLLYNVISILDVIFLILSMLFLFAEFGLAQDFVSSIVIPGKINP